jgi:DNA-binding MarR family transcriptional regulator
MAIPKRAVEPVAQPPANTELKPLYMEALTLVERLHRRLLDVIKDEFDRAGRSDVNSVQALLLFNIGESELTAGELRTRGYCLGSNVSYNLKKLTENGYIEQTRSPHDRRSVTVRLSQKGKELAASLSDLYMRHVAALDERVLTQSELAQANDVLVRLERFWAGSLGYAWRVPGSMASDAA